MNKKSLLYFIGGPGSGKGTAASLLCKRYPTRVSTFSMGAALREHARQNPALAETLATGALADEGLALRILQEHIGRVKPGVTLLVDGFPRNAMQLAALEQQGPSWLRSVPAIHFVGDEALLRKRLLKRRSEEASTRADDTEEIAERRIRMWKGTPPYRNWHGELVDVLASQGRLLTVDAAGPPEALTDRVERTISKFLCI